MPTEPQRMRRRSRSTSGPMPKLSIYQRIRAVKLRLDEVAGRYYGVRQRVYGRPGGKGDPDRRDRFSDPRSDMLTLEVWINDFCDAFEQAQPRRQDELRVRLVKGPQPKEAGYGHGGRRPLDKS